MNNLQIYLPAIFPHGKLTLFSPCSLALINCIKKLFLNKTDSGQHLVKYYFDNNKNLLTHINGRDISLTKQNEGLNIHTPESDYFILNRNFFHNTIKINKTGS